MQGRNDGRVTEMVSCVLQVGCGVVRARSRLEMKKTLFQAVEVLPGLPRSCLERIHGKS